MMTRAKDKGGRAADDVSARLRILDAAEELIAEDGFDATPTARIAKRAGVPKGLVFHYFPTKIELLTALVGERTTVDAFTDVEPEVRHGDVAATLCGIARHFREDLHASARMRRVIFREAETHPEVRGIVRQLYRDAVRQVRRGIDAATVGLTWAVGLEQRDAVAEAFATLMIHEAGLGSVTGETCHLETVARVLADGLCAPSTAAPAQA